MRRGARNLALLVEQGEVRGHEGGGHHEFTEQVVVQRVADRLTDLLPGQAGDPAAGEPVADLDDRVLDSFLERQAGRVLTMCSTRGIRIDQTVTEIGSGLNGRRTKLRKLLGDPKVSTIVVEDRDRLAWFGVEYLEAALSAHGRTVIVLDDAERPGERARDLTEVLTSLCARRYGPRSASRRAAAALAAIENEPDTAPGDPS